MKLLIERCSLLLGHRGKGQMRVISRFHQCMEHQEHNGFRR